MNTVEERFKKEDVGSYRPPSEGANAGVGKVCEKNGARTDRAAHRKSNDTSGHMCARGSPPSVRRSTSGRWPFPINFGAGRSSSPGTERATFRKARNHNQWPWEACPNKSPGEILRCELRRACQLLDKLASRHCAAIRKLTLCHFCCVAR